MGMVARECAGLARVCARAHGRVLDSTADMHMQTCKRISHHDISDICVFFFLAPCLAPFRSHNNNLPLIRTLPPFPLPRTLSRSPQLRSERVETFFFLKQQGPGSGWICDLKEGDSLELTEATGPGYRYVCMCVCRYIRIIHTYIYMYVCICFI